MIPKLDSVSEEPNSPIYYNCQDQFSPVEEQSIPHSKSITSMLVNLLGRPLMFLFTKLIALTGSQPVDLLRRPNNVHPASAIDNEAETETKPVSDGEDNSFPFVDRLHNLEVLLEELKNKPAQIPVDKEHMLHESLERIKSVEFDLNKTKSVSPLTFLFHQILLFFDF